jgi:hypothetical protein
VKCPPIKQKPYCDKNSCRQKNCQKFSYEKLQEIHETVRCYDTKLARNAFIRGNVERYDVKERKPSKKMKSRMSSYHYHLTLTLEDGVQRKYEVCKKTFLAVTGFREKIVRENAVDQGIPGRRRRGKYGRRGSSDADHQFMVNFFNEIEKAPSHYCRKNSSKIYLEPLIKKKKQLYKLYRQATADSDAGVHVNPVSITAFYRYFKSQNYSLVKPKKDV